MADNLLEQRFRHIGLADANKRVSQLVQGDRDVTRRPEFNPVIVKRADVCRQSQRRREDHQPADTRLAQHALLGVEHLDRALLKRHRADSIARLAVRGQLETVNRAIDAELTLVQVYVLPLQAQHFTTSHARKDSKLVDVCIPVVIRCSRHEGVQLVLVGRPARARTVSSDLQIPIAQVDCLPPAQAAILDPLRHKPRQIFDRGLGVDLGASIQHLLQVVDGQPPHLPVRYLPEPLVDRQRYTPVRRRCNLGLLVCQPRIQRVMRFFGGIKRLQPLIGFRFGLVLAELARLAAVKRSAHAAAVRDDLPAIVLFHPVGFCFPHFAFPFHFFQLLFFGAGGKPSSPLSLHIITRSASRVNN